jgi:FkbM family methyltransferase
VKHVHGWWFPDHERHLSEWLASVNEEVDGRLRYQGKKQDMAMKWVRNFRTAVDVGAHVGLHSFYMAKKFQRVRAFEPVEEHRQCFMRNTEGLGNVEIYPCALGEHWGWVSMHTSHGSSGDSWVSGQGDIEMRTLDDMVLESVDYIKLDFEGGELAALKGAEKTLLRCKPCVMVEQKPGRAQKFGLKETEAVDYLRALGANHRAEKSGDFVMTWDV